MIHKHHRQLRSQGGDDSPENILELEDWVHAAVHENVALAIAHGLLVPSWEEPAFVPVDLDGFLVALEGRTSVGNQEGQGGEEPMQTIIGGGEVPHRHVVDENGLEKECPRCHGAGKIVEKTKDELEPGPTRPKTTVSIRVPKDKREDGAEILRALWAGSVDLLIQAGMLRSSKGGDYFADVLAHVFFQQNFDPEKGYDQ